MADKARPGRGARSEAAPAEAGNGGGRNRRWELMETELYERAAELFARKGFAGTTLQDVADAMGISRTALYYYVKNKDDLLAKLVSQVSEEMAGELRSLRRRHSDDPEAAVRAMVRAMVSRMATTSVRFRLLILSEQDLPPDLAKTHHTAKRVIRDELAGVIAVGVDSGVFRPLDPPVAAYALVGMCNWTAWWFHPAPDHPVEPVAEQISEMGLNSLRWPDQARAAGGPADAVARIEQELKSLKRML